MVKVSVITPCYNPGKYLMPMLESVARQGDCVEKHILMDGGSTDGTIERLESWAAIHPNFEYISEKDNGQSDACQKALARVKTEYFCWLNADDILLDGALMALSEKTISVKQKPAIVYGDFLVIDGDGRLIKKRKQPTFNYWDCLHGFLGVQNAAAIFNAPLLREQGGFDVRLKFVMDYDVVLKLGSVGSVLHVRKYCAGFRLHQSSKTMTINDVCLEETEALRTRYGVTTDMHLRKFQKRLAQLRVAIRMAFTGCLGCRLRRA